MFDSSKYFILEIKTLKTIPRRLLLLQSPVTIMLLKTIDILKSSSYLIFSCQFFTLLTIPSLFQSSQPSLSGRAPSPPLLSSCSFSVFSVGSMTLQGWSLQSSTLSLLSSHSLLEKFHPFYSSNLMYTTTVLPEV